MKEFIFWFVVGLLANALMDAIDHTKGARKVRVVWHVAKWGIMIPAFILSGVSLVLYGFNITGIDAIKWFLLAFFVYSDMALWVVGALCLWLVVYVVLRAVFQKYGVPEWF